MPFTASSVHRFDRPILPGFYPDPSICRVGSDYYLVASSFQYFPGVPIFRSRNLVDWTQIGHVLTRRSQLELGGCKSSMGIFAPTLRYHDGRFYLITTNTHLFRNFYVWAERPEGPWSDPVWLDWPGIDPSLTFDEGRVYITGNGGFRGDEPLGIYQAELDLVSGELLTERRLIWTGTGGHAPEGPHLYRIEGRYYLLIAEGGTEYGHMATVARSDDPYGPFESCPHNPVLSHRSLRHPVQATGHADLVQAEDGAWWAVCLGIRPAPVPFAGQHHHLGRETFLAPVTWTADGWPVLGERGVLRGEFAPREGSGRSDEDRAAFAGPDRAVVDRFEGPGLPLHWNALRGPQDARLSLGAEHGGLVLRGGASTLSDVEPSPVWVGRRQRHFRCVAEAELDFRPEQDGEEAGLAVYMSERFHYEIALIRREGRRRVLLRRQIGSLQAVEFEADYPHDKIRLRISADEAFYRFAYAAPESEAGSFAADSGDDGFQAIGDGECALLSTETAGGFTGVYFGPYATGGGVPARNPAVFRSFRYAPL